MGVDPRRQGRAGDARGPARRRRPRASRIAGGPPGGDAARRGGAPPALRAPAVAEPKPNARFLSELYRSLDDAPAEGRRLDAPAPGGRATGGSARPARAAQLVRVQLPPGHPVGDPGLRRDLRVGLVAERNAGTLVRLLRPRSRAPRSCWARRSPLPRHPRGGGSPARRRCARLRRSPRLAGPLLAAAPRGGHRVRGPHDAHLHPGPRPSGRPAERAGPSCS